MPHWTAGQRVAQSRPQPAALERPLVAAGPVCDEDKDARAGPEAVQSPHTLGRVDRQDSWDLSVLCQDEMVLGADFRMRQISIFFCGRDLRDALRERMVYMQYADIKLYMLFTYGLYTMYIDIYDIYTFNI